MARPLIFRADIGWRYRLNLIGWRVILAMSQKKRLISAGLRAICHALSRNVTLLVTKKTADSCPFSIYITKCHEIYIYITPLIKNLERVREGGGDIYIGIYFGKIRDILGKPIFINNIFVTGA